jgi:hypothetical protein
MMVVTISTVGVAVMGPMVVETRSTTTLMNVANLLRWS